VCITARARAHAQREEEWKRLENRPRRGVRRERRFSFTLKPMCIIIISIGFLALYFRRGHGADGDA